MVLQAKVGLPIKLKTMGLFRCLHWARNGLANGTFWVPCMGLLGARNGTFWCLYGSFGCRNGTFWCLCGSFSDLFFYVLLDYVLESFFIANIDGKKFVSKICSDLFFFCFA